jgi:hypothetical protein
MKMWRKSGMEVGVIARRAVSEMCQDGNLLHLHEYIKEKGSAITIIFSMAVY